MRQQLAPCCASLVTIYLLCACSQQESSEQLQAWIAQAGDRARSTAAAPAPMPVTASFQPRPFLLVGDATPFGTHRQAAPAAQAAAQSDERPPQRGPRQLLEGLALDSLQLVGTLMQGREISALVQAGGTLYRVRIGDYLGPRFGHVQRITDSALELQELLRKTDGGWTAQVVVLPIAVDAR